MPKRASHSQLKNIFPRHRFQSTRLAKEATFQSTASREFVFYIADSRVRIARARKTSPSARILAVTRLPHPLF
jgi:nicotinate-nucleotide pyrophosphorylase